jgi:WD40 repeat protein
VRRTTVHPANSRRFFAVGRGKLNPSLKTVAAGPWRIAMPSRPHCCTVSFCLALAWSLAAVDPLPAQSKQARTDALGDPLPPGAVARLGSARYKVASMIRALALSPDGELLAGGNGILNLWKSRTGQLVRCVAHFKHGLNALAFAPDNKSLATACVDGNVSQWEVATGKELRRFDQGTLYAALAFSPDGKSLVAAHRDLIFFWEVASGNEIRTCSGHTKNVCCLAFARDGKTLVSGGDDKTLRFWDPATGKELRCLKNIQNGVRAVAFSPDGKRLATAGWDKTTCLWDAGTGARLHRIVSHLGPVTCVAFSPDGSIVASGGEREDGAIRLWSVATGKFLGALSGHTGGVHALVFLPDGKTLVSGGYDQVRLWDVPARCELPTPPGHVESVEAVAFAPDGKTLASVGERHDADLFVWDLATARPLPWTGDPPYGTESVAFAPDGKRVAAGAHDGFPLWDAATGKLLRSFHGHAHGVMSVAFHPSGKIVASAGSDNTVRLCDPDTCKQLRVLGGHIGLLVHVEFVGDGKTLVAVTGDEEYTLHLWDVATGKKLHEFDLDNHRVTAVTPDGRTLVSGGLDGSLQVWDLPGGRSRLRWQASPDPILAVAVSPDGRTFASGESDGTVRLWEIATGRERGRLATDQGRVYALCFAPDGRQLATGGLTTTILVWDIAAAVHGGTAPAGKPSPKLLNELWSALGGSDAALAYQTLWALAEAPAEAVAVIRQHLSPAAAPKAGWVQQRIADLASPSFQVRQKAMKDLLDQADFALPALEMALGEPLELETRRRVELLLKRLSMGPLTVEQRLAVRAVEALECIGTPAARDLLESLAGGAPEARLTQEARASLERWKGTR